MLSNRTRSQITQRLQSLLKIGESRHEAKRNGTAKDYIYSWNTYHTYKREMEHFASFCAAYNVNNVFRMERLVPDYIKQMQEDKRPATSQHTALSAFKKFYNDDFKEIKLPQAKRIDITRGRYATPYMQRYSEQKNEELINFLKCTGLRRNEVEHLKGGEVVEREGNYYIIVRQGKGGKYRESPILNNDPRVIERVRSTPTNKLVFGRISKHIPVHSFRAEYCNLIYESFARDIDTLSFEDRYYCRGDRKGTVFDREAMMQASKALGHERLNVIASHYLYI